MFCPVSDIEANEGNRGVCGAIRVDVVTAAARADHGISPITKIRGQRVPGRKKRRFERRVPGDASVVRVVELVGPDIRSRDF